MDGFVAAKKYDMATVSYHLNVNFAQSTFVQDDPIVAFCEAYSRGLGKTCRIAARASLKCRMNLEHVVYKLQCMNVPAFHQLYNFHRACSATAAQAVSAENLGSWTAKLPSTWWDLVVVDGKCKCVTYQYSWPYSKTFLRTQWMVSIPFHDFITRTHNALLEHPCREAVTSHQFLAPSYKVGVCNQCQLTLLGLPEFIRLLGDEIDRRISEVRYYAFTQHCASQ